jgi:hypothetical protein
MTIHLPEAAGWIENDSIIDREQAYHNAAFGGENQHA